MKKMLLFMGLFVLALVQNATAQIKVLSPNGGETLKEGNAFTITWQSSTNVSKVNIDLIADDGSWPLATDVNAFAGSYTITLPEDLPDSGKIMISAAGTQFLMMDTSDASFFIQSPPTQPIQPITVLSPNGGESFVQGDTCKITWRCHDSISQVNIYYRAYDQWGNAWNNLIASNITASSGAYSWPVSYSLSGYGWIYITSSANTTIGDFSDGQQYIQKAPVVQLLSPNGGQTLAEGSTYNIIWKSNPTLVSKVNLLLTYPSSPNQYAVIAQNIDAALGTYAWTLPYNWLPDSGKVVVERVAYNGERDSSDANVYIKRTPYLNLLTSFNGQTYVADDYITIQWQAYNFDSVKVEMTLDGINWKTIGHYRNTNSTIQIRSTLVGTNGKIRISALSNPALSDVSEGTFAQIPRTLKLLTPAGGEQLTGGTYTALQLETNQPNPSTYFTFLYSIDGGAKWQYAQYTKSGNSYSWLVPKEYTSNCLLKVESPNSDGTRMVSISQPFSIKTPVKIISPNGGETYVATNRINIKCDASRTEYILLEITYDGGLSWQTIGTYPSSTDVWYGIGSTKSGTKVKVRATSVSDPANKDESDGFFTVIPYSLRVLSPTNNEALSPGSVYTIAWEANASSSYKLSYSTDGGASWKVINAGPYSGTSYQWTVPADYSTNCLIKVNNYTYITPDAISQPFRIFPNAFKVLTPATGAYWGERSSATVTWSDPVPNATYNIHFNEGWSTTWRLLKSNVPGGTSGMYSTTVTTPSFGCDFTTYTARVRVTRVQDGAVVYSSEFEAEDGADHDCDYNLSRIGAVTQAKEAKADTAAITQTEGLRLYPNPANKVITLSLNGLTTESKTAVLSVYNSAGKRVLQKQTPVVKGAVQSKLDVAALQPGVYILTVIGASEKPQSVSFVKQ